jgi:hypothetical protein
MKYLYFFNNAVYRGSDGYNYQIKSNAINALAIQKNVIIDGLNYNIATMTNKATFKRLSDDGSSSQYDGGNANLTMTAYSCKSVPSGVNDKISVQLLPGNGSGVIFSSNWTGGKTVYQTLNGGRIQVTQPSSSAREGNEEQEPTREVVTGPPSLLKVFPNPFNTNATINFTVEEEQVVTLDVFNAMGEKVAELFNRNIATGNYSMTWNGISSNGTILSDGTYFVTLRTGNNFISVPLILVR